MSLWSFLGDDRWLYRMVSQWPSGEMTRWLYRTVSQWPTR